MNTYDWAANPQKLARVIGIGGDEAVIKANYIKIGGLLTPEYQETLVEIPMKVPEEIVILDDEDLTNEGKDFLRENGEKPKRFATKKVSKKK